MTYICPQIYSLIALSITLISSSLLAQGVMPGTPLPVLPSAGTDVQHGRGGIYGLNYPQPHQQGMSGMIGSLSGREMQDIPGIPYVTDPYGGMFGSMGNVYSPYYRRFHQQGMSGTFTDEARIPGIHYIIDPYAGMYGSMGNVYSPYYRQFNQRDRSGAAGVLNPGAVHGPGIRYHYPYFLPPTKGAM